MIISIAGGLGNQMFQYAYYYSQKRRYPELRVLADLSFYDASNVHNGYELERIFGITLDCCNETTSAKHRMTNTIFDRVLRKFGVYYAGFHYSLRDKAKGFDKRFLEKFNDDDYLYGFWQSEKYFGKYKEDIVKQFDFPAYIKKNNLIVAKQMQKTESIAIHVRRGDYLKNSMFVNLAEEGYYQKAIEEVKKKAKNDRHWFVFSDDIEWCRANLPLLSETVQYVSDNKGKESFRDMQLMSEAQYMIIANSSFSWWGAYLNKRAKMIVAPKAFYVKNTGFNKDICPDNWIRI